MCILALLYVDYVHFVGQKTVFKHCFRLIEQHLFVLISRAVMTQQQLPHPSIASHHGCLTGCGVTVLLAVQNLILAIGTLMVEGADALQLLMQMGQILGVGDIGVTAYRIGRIHESGVGNHLTILCGPISTCLDVIHLTVGNLVGLHHIPADMGLRGFFGDEITTAGHTMLQGDALHLDATILVDHLAQRGIHRIEHHLETQIVGEELDLSLQFGFQRLGGMDMEFGCTAQESEGGYHTDESEAMVAMQMGDKHMTQLGEPHPALAQLHLSAL